MKEMKPTLSGSVSFGMLGAYCEDYISELFRNRIRLKNIHSENGMIYADIGVHDYPAAARLSRKYGIRTRVRTRHGAYFSIRKLGKRPGLIAGSLLSVIGILFLRLFVWNIQIHGNNELSADYILGLLEERGITAGVPANDTDTLDAERSIMLASDKIKWINIEINGSKADVYLHETDDRTDEDIDFMTPCNIVAGRTGVIVDSDISSGQMLYENGSGVAEDSVIVSGTVSSGTSTILVHADGCVIADFFEDAEFRMDFTTVEKVPTGNSFTRKQIMILGMVFPLSSGEDISNTVCREDTEQIAVAGIELPIRIRTETYTEYEEQTVTRKTEDVRRLLDRQLEMYTENFLKQYELLDTEKTYDVSDTGIVLKARLKLRGDIAVKRPIYEH